MSTQKAFPIGSPSMPGITQRWRGGGGAGKLPGLGAVRRTTPFRLYRPAGAQIQGCERLPLHYASAATPGMSEWAGAPHGGPLGPAVRVLSSLSSLISSLSDPVAARDRAEPSGDLQARRHASPGRLCGCPTRPFRPLPDLQGRCSAAWVVMSASRYCAGAQAAQPQPPHG